MEGSVRESSACLDLNDSSKVLTFEFGVFKELFGKLVFEPVVLKLEKGEFKIEENEGDKSNLGGAK